MHFPDSYDSIEGDGEYGVFVMHLIINEIFYSIQGETTRAGFPSATNLVLS